MRNRWLAGGIGLAAALACGAQTLDAFTLADYSGEELFERFCASCHGAGGRGDGPVAPSLATAVADLTSISERYGEFSAARIRDAIDGRGVEVVAHGTRVMPVWGYEFFVEEGADIIAETEVRDAIARLVDYIAELDAGGDGGR